jgi:hypothetical protein
MAIWAHWFIDFSTMAVVPVREYMMPTGISSAAQALSPSRKMDGVASPAAARVDTFKKVRRVCLVIFPPHGAYTENKVHSSLFDFFALGMSYSSRSTILPSNTTQKIHYLPEQQASISRPCRRER